MAELTPDAHDGRTLDAVTLAKDFPLLSREVHGRTITYLDSAASSHSPSKFDESRYAFDFITVVRKCLKL